MNQRTIIKNLGSQSSLQIHHGLRHDSHLRKCSEAETPDFGPRVLTYPLDTVFLPVPRSFLQEAVGPHLPVQHLERPAADGSPGACELIYRPEYSLRATYG